MVNVDTVYQKVLALANKEQRGYITPQEFNLFANQAQLEIFEQYFYDMNQFNRLPSNETEYSNMVELLDEKISIFKRTGSFSVSGGSGVIPLNYHKLGTLSIFNNEVEEVDAKELYYIQNSPLANPGLTGKYVYTRQNNAIQVYPIFTGTIITTFVIIPSVVAWGYVVVDEKAMYDPNPARTFNFQLHASEETELVYRILSLAGVTLNKPELTQTGMGMVQQQQSTEKA